MRRAAAAGLLGLAACVLLGGCGTATHLPAAPHVGAPALVTVAPRPAGVIAVWLPGLNAAGGPTSTRGGAAIAGRLAGDILTAPRFPPGTYSCPMDDASESRLAFRYAGTSAVQRVTVKLTGCPTITAPGRAARRTDPALVCDLASIAPSAIIERRMRIAEALVR